MQSLISMHWANIGVTQLFIRHRTDNESLPPSNVMQCRSREKGCTEIPSYLRSTSIYLVILNIDNNKTRISGFFYFKL